MKRKGRPPLRSRRLASIHGADQSGKAVLREQLRRDQVELTEAFGARYLAASKSEKQKILDEFVALTGCHRKHAIRTLNGKAAAAVEV